MWQDPEVCDFGGSEARVVNNAVEAWLYSWLLEICICLCRISSMTNISDTDLRDMRLDLCMPNVDSLPPSESQRYKDFALGSCLDEKVNNHIYIYMKLE